MRTDSIHAIRTQRHLIVIAFVCLFVAAVSQAQFLPDLTVTDQWEVNGQVHFAIKNVGTMSAGTGHTANLLIDGQSVDSVVVSSKILPGSTYSGTFPKYYWKCSVDGSHTVVVKADVYNTIDEVREKNNSREETWICDVTAPKITFGPEAMYITSTSAKISWTTNEDSDSVVRYGTTSMVYKHTKATQSLMTNHQIFLDGLTPDRKYYYVVESTDTYGNTVRSSEHTFRTLPEQIDLPDLCVTDIWLQNDLVYFRLSNIGGASAASGHTASLYVDGALKATHNVTSPIAPGNYLNLAFKYPWVCENAQYSVRVEVDSSDVVEEENEQNNSEEETWTCDLEVLEIISGPTVTDITPTGATIIWTTNQSSDSTVRYGTSPGQYAMEGWDAAQTVDHEMQLEGLVPGTLYYLVVQSENPSGTAVSAEQTFQTDVEDFLVPDLIVDRIWEQSNQIHCTIKNIGDGNAAANHRAGLYVGDRLVDSATVTFPLGSGQTADVTFMKFYFECHGAEHTFRVTADIDDLVFEQDEANNSLDRTFVCDITPLKIIDGPYVQSLTMTTADIVWATNNPSDSNALYDCYARVFGLSQDDPEPTTEHAIHLQQLTPGTVYQFKVRSTNESGESVESRPGYFRTPTKGGGKLPRIRSLTFLRAPTQFPCYTMTATVEEDTEPDKVEFFHNGHLLHTDYSPPFKAVLSPGLLGVARAEFFRPWAVEAITTQYGEIADRLPGVFEPAYECNDITAEFEWPFPNETFYIPGETASADTEIPIRVHANMWETIIRSTDGIEHAPGVPDVMLDFVEWPVEEVRFYVNGAHIGTVASQPDHIYDITWNAAGLPLGMHSLRADAVGDEQCIQTITRTIGVEQGEPEIVATRQVWREGNVFRIRLNIRNAGTVGYSCSMVTDNLDGLQPIHDTYSIYRVSSAPSRDGRECTVYLDLFDTGSNVYEIRPGRAARLEYYAVPIQFPGPGAPDYEIGDDPVEVSDLWGTDEWTISCPCVRTEDGHLLDDEVDSAIEGSDYLLVTNPDLCASEFGIAADLLSETARLACHRNGVLGYPSGIGSDDPVWIRDCIRTWGATMTGSDGVAGHYLSNGYLLLVGETEILPAWTVDAPDISWTGGTRSVEVGHSDLPYGDTVSSDNVPELSVGRIIGDSVGALTQAMQASLDSGFDRSYGIATSGSESDWENFVGNVRDVVATWEDQADAGEVMTEEAKAHHWSAYVHKEQINNGHDFPMDTGDGFLTGVLAGYGTAAIRVEPDTDRAHVAMAGDLGLISSSFFGMFVLPFDSGDALAAGDIDADGEDEVIVGALGRDKLIVACDPPNTTSWTYLEFDAELEPWDVIACGRLFDLMPQEVVVVARPLDGGTVDIYEYVSSPPGLYRTWRLDIPFTSYDGLVIAEVDSANAGEEILIGSDSDQRIYVYDRRGNPLMEIPCEPYTAYDSLVAGDMDGDGADELAVLIDDVIDNKRRLHIFNNNCVAWDATAGWELVDGRSHLVYSRFLRADGARTTGGSTRYDGITCEDLDGDGKQEICLAREQSDRLYVLDGHYARGWKNRYLPVLQRDADLIDVFLLCGHGSPGSCSPFNRGDVATINLTAGPLVFALSCLTGNYEGEWWWYDSGAVDAHSDGDAGFAEAFFSQGAAAYIGATEVSGTSANAAAGPAFFAQWDPTESAGKAFRDYRRGRVGAGDLWRFWAMEYNYYGDPKFGALDDGMATASIERRVLSVAGAEPVPANPEIALADYNVVTVDGYDRVTLPGGDILMEENQPMVPIYRLEYEVPPGVVVQDVQVQHRGGLQTDIGLTLPLTLPLTDAFPEPNGVLIEPTPGWYPDREIDWQVIPAAQGASTLVVTLYPFEYNAQTTESRFYNQYTLDIETLDSQVRIGALLTDSQVYIPGDLVTVKLGLTADWLAQDAFVDTVIRTYGSDQFVAGLLLSNLSGLAGTASYATTWDSSDAAPGFYYVETKVVDTASRILARETAMFRLESQD